MKKQTVFDVRTYECDSYGHVNNANYLNYLEYGRMSFLQQIGFDYDGILKEGFFLYISHIDIRYKASAVFGDTLTVESYPAKMGAVSGTFHQTIKNQKGILCAEADVTWATVKAGGQLSKMPDKFIVPGLIPDPKDWE